MYKPDTTVYDFPLGGRTDKEGTVFTNGARFDLHQSTLRPIEDARRLVRDAMGSLADRAIGSIDAKIKATKLDVIAAGHATAWLDYALTQELDEAA